MIVIICSILATVAVVVTGLVTVGAVTAELAARPARSVFDLDEALDFVVERLSYEATANLSYEEVDQILRFHLNFLHAKGIELNGAALQDEGGAVLVDEDDALGWVMMHAEEYEIGLEEIHAVEIVDAQMEYLTGIGAVGHPAPEPADFSETDD